MSRYFHIVKDGKVVGSLGEEPGGIFTPAFHPDVPKVRAPFTLTIHNSRDDVAMAPYVRAATSAADLMTKLRAAGYTFVDRTMSQADFDRVQTLLEIENTRRQQSRADQ